MYGHRNLQQARWCRLLSASRLRPARPGRLPRALFRRARSERRRRLGGLAVRVAGGKTAAAAPRRMLASTVHIKAAQKPPPARRSAPDAPPWPCGIAIAVMGGGGSQGSCLQRSSACCRTARALRIFAARPRSPWVCKYIHTPTEIHMCKYIHVYIYIYTYAHGDCDGVPAGRPRLACEPASKARAPL